VDNVVFRPAAENWARWSGNRILQEGFYSRPVTDRILFDVFTTAVNDNATRGRLPINQSGLASWSALFSGMVAVTNNDSDRLLAKSIYRPMVIEPAGVYDSANANNWPPLVRLVDGINRTRTNLNLFPNGTFNSLGDILATPELTVKSPFLNYTGKHIPLRAIPDTATVWPGHDYGIRPSSTIAMERASNPFLRGRTLEDFLKLKAEWPAVKADLGLK
jgi:hypothetical protein